MRFAVAVVLSVFLASLLVAEEKPMTNADVVALVQAGLGDDLIITKIRQTKAASFDTSTEGLVALKKQKVSDKIVEAMVLWKKDPPPAAAAAGAAPPATESGEQASLMSRFKGRVKSALHRESEEEEKAEDEKQKAKTTGKNGNDARECAKNFKVEGSFISGRTLTTSVSLARVPKKTAFERALLAVSKDGWRVTASDHESGFISASVDAVSVNGSRSAAFNVFVKEEGSGSRVEFSFSVGPMLTVRADDVREKFCKYSEEAGAK